MRQNQLGVTWQSHEGDERKVGQKEKEMISTWQDKKGEKLHTNWLVFIRQAAGMYTPYRRRVGLGKKKEKS